MDIRDLDYERVWLISDTHLGHDNVIKYENRPEDHEMQILTNLHTVVQPDDILIHLGDVAVGSRTRVRPLAEAIPGRTILLEGNHDEKGRVRRLREWGEVIRVYEQPLRLRRRGLVLSLAHRLEESKLVEADVYLHGHSHSKRPKLCMDGLSLVANLCVEQWDYSPVSLDWVLDYYWHGDKWTSTSKNT